MATPISQSTFVDAGGNILCVKAVRTGYNNPGVISGTGSTVSANAPAQTTNIGSALTVTADAHLGTTLLFNVATGTATLPAATGTGNSYTFVSTATATSQILQVAGSDKIAGTYFLGSTTAALTDASVVSFSNKVSITMDGTTKGGIIGSTILATDVATNLWVIECNLIGSGTTTITGIA